MVSLPLCIPLSGIAASLLPQSVGQSSLFPSQYDLRQRSHVSQSECFGLGCADTGLDGRSDINALNVGADVFFYFVDQHLQIRSQHHYRCYKEIS